MDEEKKAFDFKDKKYIPYYILGAVLAVSILYGVGQSGFKRNYQANININYNALLNRAVNAVSHMEADLRKVSITNDTASSAVLYASIWNNAQNAHQDIVSLPYNQQMVSDILVYLHEASALSYILMEKSIRGENPSAYEQDQLADMQKRAAVLSKELQFMVSEINISEESILWDNIHTESPDIFESEGGFWPEALLGSMYQARNQMEDNAYKSKVEAMALPKLLEDAYLIGVNEGIPVVRSLLKSYGAADIHFIGATDVTEENVLAIYSYEAVLTDAFDAEFTVDITQDGGYPIMMVKHTRDYSGSNFMSVDKAIRLADKFLYDAGYDYLTAVYHEVFDSIVYLSYYPVVDEIIYYPDEIKVKVNLSNGDILGFWAGDYIQHHHIREVDVNISRDRALEMLKEGFDLDTVQYAFIATDHGEVLCYEFDGTYNGDYYKVYINAANGNHENTVLVNKNIKGVYVR